MNLLIVDKQPMVRSGLKTIITSENKEYSIDEASTIAEALNIVNNNNPEVVILDIDLADESGIKLMDKAKEICKEPKFIVFTSSITKSDFNRCEDIGVGGYVMKDAFVEDIIFALKSVLRGKKYYDPQVVNKTIKSKKEDKLSELTEREKEVFNAVGKGMTNGQIAASLFISESTVKKYVSHVLNKLNLKNRAEIICFLYNTYEK